MSIDIINDEDNFLKLLGDEEEDLSQNDDLLYMEIPNFNPVPSDGSDSGKTDDDSSVSGTNEASENTTSGRWNAKEHELFLQGLHAHGKGWKKIAEMIQTRNVVQVRTHAQKYFQKLERSKQQEQMSDEDGNPTGNVIGPVSVSIAEKSSISIADLSSVIKASSSGSVSTAGEVKTTSKRKRKVNRDFVEDDDKDSAKLTISLKKGRKANKTKRTAFEFDTLASQDETDEETKSETSNIDYAHINNILSSTATSSHLDMYDNEDSSQTQGSLKIILEKTKEKGGTGTPSPTSVIDEANSTISPVLDDWLHIGNASLNFHNDLISDSNGTKGNNLSLKHPVAPTSTGFYESTFDENIITQDILEIFEV